MFPHRRRFLAPALALAAFPLAALAQTGADAPPPAQTPAAPSAPPADQATGLPATQNPQQQRAQVLREAQARVNARRHLRVEQVIQDTYTHKFEIYGGGAYLRFRPGTNLQHNTEGAWNAGLTDWIRPKLGITADFRGYYGSAVTNNFEFQVFKPSISQYTFLGGPQYRIFEGEHWSWSGQVLAGVTHGNFSTGLGSLTGTNVGLYPDSNRLAISVGVPIDYNLGPALAVRLMPNYLLTNYGSDIQHNLGFTVGIVYRFGRQ